MKGNMAPGDAHPYLALFCLQKNLIKNEAPASAVITTEAGAIASLSMS